MYRRLPWIPVVVLAVVSVAGCALVPRGQQTHTTAAPPPEPAEVAATPPERVASFPAAEAMLSTAASRWEKATVYRAYLQRDDWNMVRDQYGTILARTVPVHAFYRSPTGECWYGYSCGLRQEAQGREWGKPGLQCGDGRYQRNRVTCASIKGLPGTAYANPQ